MEQQNQQVTTTALPTSQVNVLYRKQRNNDSNNNSNHDSNNDDNTENIANLRQTKGRAVILPRTTTYERSGFSVTSAHTSPTSMREVVAGGVEGEGPDTEVLRPRDAGT